MYTNKDIMFFVTLISVYLLFWTVAALWHLGII